MFRWIAAAAIPFLLACRDSTGPDDLQVIVGVRSVSSASVVEVEGWPQVTCLVDLTAEVHGAGRAVWYGAKIRWFVGADRSAATDSVSMDGGEVAAGWSRDTLDAQFATVGQWSISYIFPFEARFEFVYRAIPDGTPRTAVVEFRCGPPVNPGASPPVVDAVTLSFDADIEPGDSVKVDYSARSTEGLWGTAVVLEPEACEAVVLFSENSRRTVDRSTKLKIPETCPYDTEVRATVLAFDAAAHVGRRTSATAVRVIDATTPSLFVSLRRGTGNHFFFVGGTLELDVDAGDLGGLAAIVWDVGPGGRSDSISVAGTNFRRSILIPMSADWIGRYQFRVRARDVSGLSREWISDSVKVVATVERPTIVGTIGGRAIDLVIDDKRRVAYVRQNGLAYVAVVSLATGVATETIALPSSASDLDLSASGDSLIVALASRRTLGIVDLLPVAREVVELPIAALASTPDRYPGNVRIAANGRAFVGTSGSPPYELIEVTFAPPEQRIRDDGDFAPQGIERSHDRTALVMAGGVGTCLVRYNTATDAFTPCRPGIGPGQLTLDRTGAHVASGFGLAGPDLALLRRVESVFSGGVPGASTLSADGEHLFYSGSGLIRARTSDGRVVDRAPLPFLASIYRVSPDGTVLVAIEEFATPARIAIVDLRQ